MLLLLLHLLPLHLLLLHPPLRLLLRLIQLNLLCTRVVRCICSWSRLVVAS
jgi:hypothetical protein